MSTGKHESEAVVERLNLIPTFGNPASDNMFSSGDATQPSTRDPIGRLSVVNGKEIEDYLEKVKEYENTQKNSTKYPGWKGMDEKCGACYRIQ